MDEVGIPIVANAAALHVQSRVPQSGGGNSRQPNIDGFRLHVQAVAATPVWRRAYAEIRCSRASGIRAEIRASAYFHAPSYQIAESVAEYAAACRSQFAGIDY